MVPPEKKPSQKSVPGRSTQPAVNYTNLSEKRHPQGKGLQKTGTCAEFQQPQCASEPPKILNQQGAHPTARHKVTTGDSSNASRRATTGNGYRPTSKKSEATPDVPKRQATTPAVPVSGTQLSAGEIAKIERQTRGQRENPEWYSWRQNRITASLAHQISNSRFANQKTSAIPQSYLKAILGSAPHVQTAAMNWGIKNEKKAVNSYEKLASVSKGKEVQVEECGLFIHPTSNWLAASPDGIVKDRRTGETLNILEVKCPFKHREHTIREACKDRDFCLVLNGDSYTLKSKHAYYTQVQCQMAVTRISDADFVVYTKKETAVIPVKFDPEFWEAKESKLKRFYMEAVLPNVKHGGASPDDIRHKEAFTPEE
ncbi:hypothetical protein GDO81_007780 [Engystomops pustulosus]|uniref:YqaJ viral recombinase domain-containing protein n=1 Tax=Engystomops pustulosus TaxID=76066 RepID=A0AAV7C9L5_ENGPU|nr:hypothetical protein GDO81_007780 [Engystomops pustulosus]